MDHKNNPLGIEYPEIQSLEELFPAKGIAGIIGISPRIITLWRTEYGLPYVRLGKFAYFSKAQVVAFLNHYQKNVPDKVAILGRQLAAKAAEAKRIREKN
jgi:hypothetical protein